MNLQKIQSEFNRNFLVLFAYTTVLIIVLFIAFVVIDFQVNELSRELNSTDKIIPIDYEFKKTIVSIPINLTTGLDSTLLTAIILCNFNDDAYWQLKYDNSQESWAIQCIEEES